MSYLVSPYNTINQVNRELTRLFNDQSSSSVSDISWSPQVDISETEQSYLVTADMPGVKPEDIEINLHEGVLTIKGERHAEEVSNDKNFTRRERVRGTFFRQFKVPQTADGETVSARSSHGVLEITIPKVQEAQPIKIVVEGN